jgi:hypothetical protein
MTTSPLFLKIKPKPPTCHQGFWGSDLDLFTSSALTADPRPCPWPCETSQQMYLNFLTFPLLRIITSADSSFMTRVQDRKCGLNDNRSGDGENGNCPCEVFIGWLCQILFSVLCVSTTLFTKHPFHFSICIACSFHVIVDICHFLVTQDLSYSSYVWGILFYQILIS